MSSTSHNHITKPNINTLNSGGRTARFLILFNFMLYRNKQTCRNRAMAALSPRRTTGTDLLNPFVNPFVPSKYLL